MEGNPPSPPAPSSSIYVDLLTPALVYPATLSRSEIISNCQRDLCINSDDCFFYDISNDRIGCLLKNNKFTMEFVEKQYHQTILLSEQLERAADALKTFQDRMVQDQEIMGSLRNQIEELKIAVEAKNQAPPPAVAPSEEIDWKVKYEEEVSTRRNLQDKLQKLKSGTQNNHGNSEEINEPEPAPTPIPMPEVIQVKPKVLVPKLALSIKIAPTSPNVGLRSKSSSDLNVAPPEETRVLSVSSPSPNSPNIHSPFFHQDQDFANFTTNFPLDEKAFGVKRRNTIANLKPFGDPLDISLPQEALSQCRLCGCDVFRATQKAGWICLCGHTSIKHANIPYKISPRAMSPRSPRAFGGL